MAAECRVYIWNVFCCLQIILCDNVIVVWVTRFLASLYKIYVGMVSLLKVFLCPTTDNGHQCIMHCPIVVGRNALMAAVCLSLQCLTLSRVCKGIAS